MLSEDGGCLVSSVMLRGTPGTGAQGARGRAYVCEGAHVRYIPQPQPVGGLPLPLPISTRAPQPFGRQNRNQSLCLAILQKVLWLLATGPGLNQPATD